jgi:2-polyprenyl-3-methyl-5-hydroxy-6-metoxy-1,4-benzoquinol methylase
MKQAPIKDYVSRDEKILEVCRGKRVLHLGCVGFTDCPMADKIRLARQSLHQRLTENSECLGVDLDAETLAQLQAQQVFSNVVVGNVEQLELLPANLPKFDVVVAGDIIEHLSNPGKMLDGVSRWLRPGGVLIVSAPNSMGLPAFVRYLFGRFREGLQHVLCFNPITLAQLLERHGYQVRQAMTCHQSAAARQHGWRFAAGRSCFRLFPKLGGTLLFVAQPLEASGKNKTTVG